MDQGDQWILKKIKKIRVFIPYVLTENQKRFFLMDQIDSITKVKNCNFFINGNSVFPQNYLVAFLHVLRLIPEHDFDAATCARAHACVVVDGGAGSVAVDGGAGGQGHHSLLLQGLQGDPGRGEGDLLSRGQSPHILEGFLFYKSTLFCTL